MENNDTDCQMSIFFLSAHMLTEQKESACLYESAQGYCFMLLVVPDRFLRTRLLFIAISIKFDLFGPRLWLSPASV